MSNLILTEMKAKFIYNIFRTYNLLLAILPSIGFYRATVQPEYKWGLLAIHGKGTSGDYWILVFFMLFAWATFILGSWFKRKWYYFFPIFLYSFVAFYLTYGYLTNNEMVFQGDVWKIKIQLGLIVVIISVLLLLMTVIWSIIDFKNFKPLDFKASNPDRKKLLISLSISFIILILFGQGKGGVHTVVDGIAVAITIIQALVLAHFIEKTSICIDESKS